LSQLKLEGASADKLLEMENKLRSAGYRLIAGVDEVGRGPLAGPVVAAAVVFPDNLFIPGINDSKLLSPQKREILSGLINEKALAFGIGQCSPALIDEINILQASLLAMRRAVDNLGLSPNYLLIDGRYTLPDYSGSQQAVIKGDRRCFSIAAASIIAKVERDRIMVEYHRAYPEYGFDRHKGYPTKAHREAIIKYGYCDIHRRSFKVSL